MEKEYEDGWCPICGDPQTVCDSYGGHRMRDEPDLDWCLHQIEKYMGKNHSPAENIMNIITNVKNRVMDKKKVKEVIEKKRKEIIKKSATPFNQGRLSCLFEIEKELGLR